MTYWILTEAGYVVARSTVQHVTITDMASNAIKHRVLAFDEHLLTRLNDDNYQIDMTNHVFYLQDDATSENAYGDNGHIPQDTGT